MGWVHAANIRLRKPALPFFLARGFRGFGVSDRAISLVADLASTRYLYG